MCVPVFGLGRKVIAVVELLNKMPRTAKFQAQDIELMQDLAIHLSIALERMNANLVNKVRPGVTRPKTKKRRVATSAGSARHKKRRRCCSPGGREE